MDNHFIILITAYNCKEWIRHSLSSAEFQKYTNYDVVVVDDHSTDGTWDIIQEYDFIKHRNDVRVGDSLPNTIMALKLYSKNPNDIIVHLDGDDWLNGSDVLSYLNEVYEEDIWLTYGQYEPADHSYHNYCTPIPDTRTYRRSGVWRTSHLKTWKKWLWDKIDDKDLHNADGNYFDAATDNAFMYPMVEMAGAKHIKFIDKVLYIYNNLNPSNYMKERADDLIRTSEYIRNKSIYDEL